MLKSVAKVITLFQTRYKFNVSAVSRTPIRFVVDCDHFSMHVFIVSRPLLVAILR